MNNRQTAYLFTILTIISAALISYACVQAIEIHAGGYLWMFGLFMSGGCFFGSILNCLHILGHDYDEEQTDEFGMHYPTPETSSTN